MIQYTSVIPFWKWDGKSSSLVSTEVSIDDQGDSERENKENLYMKTTTYKEICHVVKAWLQNISVIPFWKWKDIYS